ncbi:hypothetical protein ES703_91586 [subsurface metagenome]
MCPWSKRRYRIAVPSGDHSYIRVMPNSSSYSQSDCPLMISLDPSRVSCLVRPLYRSNTYRLLPMTYATLRLSGEKVALDWGAARSARRRVVPVCRSCR